MENDKTIKEMKKPLVDRCLDAVERACNKLPPPAILFVWLFVFVAVLSAILAWCGVSSVNPATGETVVVNNLFSKDGVQWLLANMLTNFTDFAPLGLVVVLGIGIGICENSGLIKALLHSSLKKVPASLAVFVLTFIAVCGNIASDTAIIVLPPLAAILYMSIGKHPVLGMITAYAGAQAGFTANVMISGTDATLAGITNSAITGFMPDSGITADVTGNWYFMIASTFLVTMVIALVSEKIVAPRFGIYTGNTEEGKIQLSPEEHKGLRAAGITSLIFLALVLLSFFTGITAGEDGAFIGSPLLKNITVVLFLLATAAGLAFGFASGKFRNSHDVNASMVNATKNLSSFILFCFICGQFSGLFAWSNLGTLLAIGGANFLQSINFTGMGMCVVFIIISALVNILVYSGSAKWAIFAPVFVPMFMMLGYHPSFAQLLYRLGDSPVDCLTPMCPYIWMLLETAKEKYDPKLKIGTVVASMVPIALILQVVWILFLLLWMALDLPIGPGVSINLP